MRGEKWQIGNLRHMGVIAGCELRVAGYGLRVAGN